MAETAGPVPSYANASKANPNNFSLGGTDPDWLKNFSQGQTNTQNNAQQLRWQGQGLNQEAGEAATRGGPLASYNTANQTLGQAGNTLKSAQTQGQDQANVAGQLEKFAQGPQGPSAAQAQLNKGTDAALNSQLAMARSGSGFGESATALDSASRNASSTIAGAANDAATLKAQEDQNFRNQQMGALTGAANIYQGQQSGTLAEAQQQQAIAAQQGGQSEFNTNAQLQTRGQNDALNLGLSDQSIQAQNAAMSQDLGAQGLTLNAQQADQQGRENLEQTDAQLYGTDADVFKARMQHQVDMRNLDQQRGRDEVSGVGTAIGSIAGAFLSDKRAKKNIKPDDDLLDAYRALAKRGR